MKHKDELKNKDEVIVSLLAFFTACFLGLAVMDAVGDAAKDAAKEERAAWDGAHAAMAEWAKSSAPRRADDIQTYCVVSSDSLSCISEYWWLIPEGKLAPPLENMVLPGLGDRI